MKLTEKFKAYLEQSAVAPGKLSEFGSFARWLFVAGMADFIKNQGNDSALAEITPLLNKSWTLVDQRALQMFRYPAEFIRRNADMAFIKANVDKINGWFNNYIRDLPEITSDEKDLFKKAIYLVKYSHHASIPATTLDAIERYAKLLSAKLGQVFASAIRLKTGTKQAFSGKQEIDQLYSELEEIVKTYTKEKGTRIPLEKIKELKLKNDPVVTQQIMRYDEIRKQLKILTNNALYLILSNGVLKADTAAKEMKAQGFRDFPFPTTKDGYTGSVGLDSAGKLALFTNEGKQLVGGVAPGSKITMNKNYNPTKDDSFYFLFKAPGAVGNSRAYTTTFKQINIDAKHQKTVTNTDKVDTWVKVWERDLQLKDPMRNVPAAVALLLYLTSGRIGTSKENISMKGAAQTYGISTLRKNHVKVTSASIILDYNGKKGVHQRHVLKLDTKVNKRIGVILKRLLEGKKKDDLVFSFTRPNSRAGAQQEVNPTFFRNYLKSTGVTINPHALRHIRGTELATKLLAENDWKPTTKARTLAAKQREAETFMKDKILSQVANLLGHKAKKNGVEVPAWRTSIQSYVHPQIIKDWFSKHQLETPRWVPQKLTEE